MNTNFTFASKEKEYVANYNKSYYANVTKIKNAKKNIAEIAKQFAKIEDIESILNTYDNVIDFASYILTNDTQNKYTKEIGKLVKVCNKFNLYFDFKCKCKLLSAIYKSGRKF